MTNALSLRVGDRLPDFVLPGLDGKLRKFIWSFTGDPVVLLAVADLGLIDAEPFAALRAACTAATTRLVVVSASQTPAATAAWKKFGAEPESPLLLLDQKGQFLPALLSQGGAVSFGQGMGLRQRAIVLDPNQRVAGTFDTRVLAATTEAIGALADSVRANAGSDVRLDTAMAPVLILPRVFEPDFCTQLIRLWGKGDRQDGGVSSRYGNVNMNELKRTEDYMIVEPMMQKAVSDRLAYRIGPELTKVFAFDRQFTFDAHVVLSYSAEGGHFFGAHRDVLEEGVGEYEALLVHHTALAAPGVVGDVAQIGATEQHFARRRFVVFEQQFEQGGFAAAAGADNGRGFALRNEEPDLAQGFAGGVGIFETDVAQHEVAVGR